MTATQDRINSLLVDPTATIKEAMEKLNNAPEKIVFCTDETQRIVGCITDGDVRRALLRGETIQSLAIKSARKEYTFADPQTSQVDLVRLMKRSGIRQIPVIDNERKLIGVHTLDQFLNPNTQIKNFPVVIMAGGRGSRLGSYTVNTPKPLLQIGGQALIERIIEKLSTNGSREFYITVNYLADQIIEHLGDGSRFGCTIHYIRETEPLGTAGSLSLLKGKLLRDFLVINGDVLSTVDTAMMLMFHLEHRAAATLCSKLFNVKIPYGVVTTDGPNITGIEEKPELLFNINAGMYFLSPDALDYVTGQAQDMPQLLLALIANGKPVKCFRSSEPWIDIGSHLDFESAQKNLEYFTK